MSFDLSSLSTSLSQDRLFTEVGAAVGRKGLDAQKLDGENLMRLIDSAQTVFRDPALGTRVDIRA